MGAGIIGPRACGVFDSGQRRIGARRRRIAFYRARGRSVVSRYSGPVMCRNIRTLYNFDPPTTQEEIRSAALQYVRKVSGMQKPSQANEHAFDQAVDEVETATARLLESLVTSAPPRDREVEAARRRARAVERFGKVA
jgi:hypothetical protein